MTNPRVSVIVPVFNKVRFLQAALDSIITAVRQYGNAELIVVDHTSTDGSRELLQARYARDARIGRLRGGTIGAVRNLGARAATGPVLSFIDADCVIPPDYFSNLVDVLAATGAEATGAEVVPPPSPGWVEDVWYRLHRRAQDGDQEWIGSANFAVLRDAFETVDGFDERLLTGEDTELCQRLRDSGVRIYESKRLSVVHLDSPRTVAEFFRKELWRAMGMLGTVRATSIDKPTVMTVLHVVLCLTALGVLALASGPGILDVAAALGLALAVPVATLAYRAGGGGSLARPLRALLLYEVYYAARATALVRLLFRPPVRP